MIRKLRVALAEVMMGKLWRATRSHIGLSAMRDCGGVALIGDSITHLGKWDLLFPDAGTRNLGIAGERSEHLLARIEPLVEMKPSKVFVLIGTNDLAIGFTIDEIVENVEKLIDELRTRLPDAEIYLQGVMPRNRKFAERIHALNARYHTIAQERGATFVDLFPVFDDGTGQIRSDFSEDELHLNGLGYAAWRAVLAPLVTSNL